MSHYHQVADKTMDRLLESLEELYEVESTEGYEVEFHVRDPSLSTHLIIRQLIYKHFSARVESSHLTWVLTELTSLTNNLRISRSGCLHHSGMPLQLWQILIYSCSNFYFSGPKRYDYIENEDKWVYSRDGRTLHSLLSDELSTALGRTIDVPPPV